MNRSNEHAQRWKSRSRRVGLAGTLAVILLGLASTSTVLAGEPRHERGEVKVERKAKFISNGPGQKPFNVTRHTVPVSEIQRSVPKDAIPALVEPQFVRSSEIGNLLAPKDRVLGVYLNGEAKAYPIRILNWHELVNDEVGGQPILVSW